MNEAEAWRFIGQDRKHQSPQVIGGHSLARMSLTDFFDDVPYAHYRNGHSIFLGGISARCFTERLRHRVARVRREFAILVDGLIARVHAKDVHCACEDEMTHASVMRSFQQTGQANDVR